jgi:hypothetical protein
MRLCLDRARQTVDAECQTVSLERQAVGPARQTVERWSRNLDRTRQLADGKRQTRRLERQMVDGKCLPVYPPRRKPAAKRRSVAVLPLRISRLSCTVDRLPYLSAAFCLLRRVRLARRSRLAYRIDGCALPGIRNCGFAIEGRGPARARPDLLDLSPALETGKSN